MNGRPFQQFQLVPFSGACGFIDPDKEAYFSVRIDACGPGDDPNSLSSRTHHLVRVFLLPLRGRAPAEAATAIALDDFSVTLWDFLWREKAGASPINHLVQAVATVERWLRESQHFADLCVLELPQGFYLDAKLCLTNRNEWGYVPGYSPPLGEWVMSEGDGDIVWLSGSNPAGELANPVNGFSAAFIASWMRPVSVAHGMVQWFLAGEIRASEMLAQVEPEIPQKPAPVTLETLSGPGKTDCARSRFLRVLSKVACRMWPMKRDTGHPASRDSALAG